MLLSKMAQENLHRSSSEGAIISSRIKATFETPRGPVRVRASVNAYTDGANNDVMLASKQRWQIMKRRGKPLVVEFPLSVFGPHGPEAERSRYIYYSYHLPSQRSLFHGFDEKRFRSSIPILSDIAGYCRRIRYYGASQFTNPGSCPVSFEIEQQEHPHALRARLPLAFRRGHARILYDMYTAWRAGSPQYKQFIEIVGLPGLGLIDKLTFREVPISSVTYSVRVGGKVESRKRNKLLVIPQFKIGRQKLSPNQLSEGTFKTLALLFHITAEDSSALLVEEPEVCIHHGLLSSILELIKSYSRRKQMIISTHSDYVLDHVVPENVFRVTFDKTSGTLARHIRKTMTSKEFTALREYLEKEGNLGEYWREGGFGDRQ